MKKKLLVLFAVLSLSGLPQSGGSDTLYFFQDTSLTILNKLVSFKFSVSSFDLFSEQIDFNPEPSLFTFNDESESRKSP